VPWNDQSAIEGIIVIGVVGSGLKEQVSSQMRRRKNVMKGEKNEDGTKGKERTGGEHLFVSRLRSKIDLIFLLILKWNSSFISGKMVLLTDVSSFV
jgi:hypothetical protein